MDVTHDGGGIASKEEYRFDLIDPEAMLAMAHTMWEREDRPAGNWRKLSVEVHLNHLIIHVMKHLRGDRDEDHLARVMCRAFMAWSVNAGGISPPLPSEASLCCKGDVNPGQIEGIEEDIDWASTRWKIGG